MYVVILEVFLVPLIVTIPSSQNGAVVAAIFQVWYASKSGRLIALPAGDDESEIDSLPGGESPDNPLANVDVSKKALITIFAVSIGGSIVSAFVFVVSILSSTLSNQVLRPLLVCRCQELESEL